ncbi:MAG: zinc ribbon domain-containing protein [Verrucomicrobiota bacterium]
MPIYEFACPKCRVIFNFLSKRIEPDRSPVCPKCGNKKLAKQMSSFAALKGAKETAATNQSEPGMPDVDDPRMMRAMAEMERDMAHMDENNPKHMAQMMRKMKDFLPAGSTPKEFEVAIKRLESGEDPEKIEADMGDVLGDFLGDEEPAGGAGGGGYSRDSGLYDY